MAFKRFTQIIGGLFQDFTGNPIVGGTVTIGNETATLDYSGSVPEGALSVEPKTYEIKVFTADGRLAWQQIVDVPDVDKYSLDSFIPATKEQYAR
jgi:hypothetical protein